MTFLSSYMCRCRSDRAFVTWLPERVGNVGVDWRDVHKFALCVVCVQFGVKGAKGVSAKEKLKTKKGKKVRALKMSITTYLQCRLQYDVPYPECSVTDAFAYVCVAGEL